MSREVWKPINGFVGAYWISDKGRVKNSRGKLLKPIDNGHGYMRVDLRSNGQREQKLIHRLVAEHFIPNAENKPEVNHKDKKRNKNAADNLEWVTRQENEEHKHSNKEGK